MAVTTSYEDAGEVRELRSTAAAETLLLDVVHRHADELLRVAQAHSLCADDAHDAYQRSLEHFLRNGRRLRRETAERWLFTVVKREAQAVRRARCELVGAEDFDFDRLEARGDASPEDHALAADAVARSAEALRSLKPQEVRALWLRAGGSSYAEIQAATGWSYTKVNRCLTEGRRAFFARCAELEAGAQCERWRGVLAALAGGEAKAEDLAALRPHLRRCAACQATLRALHASGASVATVLPPGLVGLGAAEGHGGAERLEAAGRWLTRAYEAVAGPVQERAAAGALKWQAAVEAAAGGKVAAVAASTVALAGGGAVAAQDPVPRGRPAAQRAAVHAATAAPAVARAAPRRFPRATGFATMPPAPLMREPRPVRPTTTTAPRGRGSRTRARPAYERSPGRREFGGGSRGFSPAAIEFRRASRRRTSNPGSVARTIAQRSAASVAASVTPPARTDFARPAPRRTPTASPPPPARPAGTSPAASEFGP